LVKKKFPNLYGKSSTGKVKLWMIRAEEYKGKAAVVTEYGYEDGEMQYTSVEINKGKNIGRTNETTPFEQACSEAESKWNKKKDKGYVEEKKDLSKEQQVLPMLAHSFKKRGHDIEWPAFVQPKLNGVRCLAQKVGENEILYLSRGGKQFNVVEHLTPHILALLQVDEIFDGEIFTQDLSLQEIVSAVKKANPNTPKLQYWIYDCVQPEAGFSERNRHLNGLIEGKYGPLVSVPTLDAKNEDMMKKLHVQFMKAGYEGTIIRNKHGRYKCNHRSKDLQKYKDFIDEEFEIVGGKEGRGRDKGAITWTCLTEDGKRFDVRPRGTMEQRQEWWKNMDKYIGKKLTVRYLERSNDNIPIGNTVGLAMRDYE